MLCSNCKYTEGQTGGSLTCQRYPQPHRVAQTYWCGEYKPRTEEKAEQKRRGLRPTLTISEQPTVERKDK